MFKITKNKLISFLKKTNYNRTLAAKHFKCSKGHINKLIKEFEIKYNVEKKRRENISKKLKNHRSWSKGRKWTKNQKDNLSKIIIERKNRDGFINSPEARKKRGEATKGENHFAFGKTYEEIYGVKKANKIKTKQRKKMLNNLAKRKVKVMPFFNQKACEFFKSLNDRFDLEGYYAENGGEFHIKELGYFVDYYEPNLNLVIEWNEEKHYDVNKLNDKHLKRQRQIKNKLGCMFVNIRESKFNQRKILCIIQRKIKKIA